MSANVQIYVAVRPSVLMRVFMDDAAVADITAKEIPEDLVDALRAHLR